jgi:bla regulator protein BlaR1
MNWEWQSIDWLAAALVRPFVLVAAAWLILRVMKIRHPASRHAVWTAVLIGMLMLPLVSAMAPHWRLPVLAGIRETAPTIFEDLRSNVAMAPTGPMAETATSGKHRFEWPGTETAILWCYFAGLLTMITYRTVGWALLRRVLSRSTPLRAERLRESADVLIPVAVGVLRPVVILPAGWRVWNSSVRRAVLAHEFAHLRRHNTLVAALSRLVTSIFWFHPLAWWVSRRVSNLAELACDAAALERVGDPAGYSRILLAFAGAVNDAGRRVALPGLAMAASSDIGERIDQVFEMGTMRRLARPGAVLALLGVPVLCLAAAVGLGPKPVLPQTQTTASKFEVASVRACRDGAGRSDTKMGPAGGSPTVSPGRLNTGCALLAAPYPMAGLIQRAYGRLGLGHPPSLGSALPISGGPSWIFSDYYVINAETADKAGEPVMEGPMLQALLEDRFKLKVHRETREVPVYALTVAKGGFKLARAVEGSCVASPQVPEGKKRCDEIVGGGFVMLDDGSVDVFGKLLGLALDRPVIDKTGLTGRYNFHFQFAIDQTTPGVAEFGPTAGAPAAPSIFTAVQEQFGLKLEATRGPREFLVIDHVERPSEN